MFEIENHLAAWWVLTVVLWIIGLGDREIRDKFGWESLYLSPLSAFLFVLLIELAIWPVYLLLR